MSGLYVASNVGALGAATLLQRNNSALGDVLTRLSTGLRINSGKDDPAGLIASELLKSDISATQQAVKNTQRANSIVAVADSALSQVGNLLNDVRTLVNEGANTGAMSDDQIAANQLQIDASIDSIDRISRTTNFQGKKLLDGSLDFRTSGIDGGKVQNVSVQSANFGTADSLDVKINMMEEARNGELHYLGAGTGNQDVVLEIGGNKGSEIFKFGANTSNAEMADAINRVSDATGVEAFVEGEAERGQVVLSSAGANNDILITAKEAGFDNGNYTFRIVEGDQVDARIVSGPDASKPGVVEISVTSSYEKRFDNIGGLYNITVSTDFAADSANQDTSVTMTRGTENSAQFFETDSAASGTTLSGTTGTVQNDKLEDLDLHNSKFNGWTVTVNDQTRDGGDINFDNKTITLNSTDLAFDADGNSQALNNALIKALGGTAADTTVAGQEDANNIIKLTGQTLKNGDSFTLKNGGSAGELFIQYKEGATVGDIQNVINNAPNVQATLADPNIDPKTLVSAMPGGETHAVSTSANVKSKYTSGTTSQQVIDAINSKLGGMFEATSLGNDGTGGRVSYQDASIVYGDTSADNALRFSGMDNGPVVRISNTDANGVQQKNQKLSVSILQPTDADRANGIHTPILQVNLATDSAGNSISTAKDIADLFDSLTAEQTLGVSAEVVSPTDPNGRTWLDDGCGNTIVNEDCGATFGLGVVQPTGKAGDCEVINNDLILLGQNQKVVDDYAVAKIGTADSKTTGSVASGSLSLTDATGTADPATGTLKIETTDKSNLLNGLNIVFNSGGTAGNAAFDIDTGTLTVDVATNFVTSGNDAAAIQDLVNAAIATVWDKVDQAATETGNGIADWVKAANPAATDAQVADPMTVTVSGDMTGAIMDTAAADGGYAGQAITLTGGAQATGGAAGGAVASNNIQGTTIAGTDSNAAAGVQLVGNDALAGYTIEINSDDPAPGTNPATVAGKTIMVYVDALTSGTTTQQELVDAINASLAGGTDTTGFSVSLADPATGADTLTGATSTQGNTVDGSVTFADTSKGAAASGIFTPDGTSTVDYSQSTISADQDTSLLNGKSVKINIVDADMASDPAVVVNGDELVLNIDVANVGDAATAEDIATILSGLDDDVKQAWLGAGGEAITFTGNNTAAGTALTAIGDGLTISFMGGADEASEAAASNVTGIQAISTTDTANGGLQLTTTDGTSALNGMTINYTYDETREGFDYGSSTLTVFVNPELRGSTDEQKIADITNSAIAAQWSAISAKTNATTDAVKVEVSGMTGPISDQTSVQFASSTEDLVGSQRGVGGNDAAMTFTAKQAGTEYSGMKIRMVYDENASGLSVTHQKDSNEMVIVSNQKSMAADDLASQLNANAVFTNVFDAEALKFAGNGTDYGTIYFDPSQTAVAGEVVGGYRIETNPSNAGSATAASNGLAMLGGTDANEKLVFRATDTGSSGFVNVNVVDGNFRTFCPLGYEMSYLAGKDAVVTINGQKAEANGNDVTISSSALSMTANVAGMKAGETTSFTLNGGGATFQLGPDVVSTQQYTLGIQSMNSANLGGISGKLYQLKTGENASLKNDTKLADRIVQEAINSVATTRGQLGAIQKSVFEPNIAVLEDTIEQLSSAEALISNADFATESSNMTRLQLLIQSGSRALALANQTPQYAASLI